VAGSAALFFLLAFHQALSADLTPVLALVPAESTTAVDHLRRKLLSLNSADVAVLADMAVGQGSGAGGRRAPLAAGASEYCARAQMTVHGLAVLVAGPGRAVKRAGFIRAIAGRIGVHASRPEAVEFLVQQVWLAGGEEAAYALRRLADDPRVRECAARYLSALESRGSPELAAKVSKEAVSINVTALVQALGSPDARVRAAARNDLLFGAGPEAEGEMARLLPSVSPKVRAVFISILGSRVAVAQADRIAPYAEDPDPCVRAEACKALYARFGMPDPAPKPSTALANGELRSPTGPDELAKIGIENSAALIDGLRVCMRLGKTIEKDLEAQLAEAEAAVGPSLPCEDPLPCGPSPDALKTALREAEADGVLARGDPQSIGQAVRWAYREEIRALFECAVGKSPDALVRARAEHMIRELDLTEGYITAWRVSGPYNVPGVSGTPLLDARLAPETSPDTAAWKPVDAGGIDNEPWEVNLMDLEYTEEGVAYLTARVFSDASRPALLLVGSDDGVEIRLNGSVVHRRPVLRGLVADNDRAKIRLRKGWNKMLVKVSQSMGEWGVSVRLRATDGGRLTGVHSAP